MKSDIPKKFNRLKVVHLLWGIPHYRVPIFRRLSQNTNFNFEVCAGDNTEIPDGAKVASANEIENIAGVNWRHLKSRRLKGVLFRDFEWQPEAVKIAWKEDIDVVISLGYKSLSNIILRIICQLRGIPIIEWTIGVKRPERGLRWLIRKFYYKWATAFLLYGEFARDFFISHGFKKEQIFVVRNSLDYDRQMTIREKISSDQIEQCRRNFGIISPNHRLIFNSGRFEKGKRLHTLIEALALLKQRGCYVQCILIGDGRRESALKLLAREGGVADKIVFYGACYNEETLGLIISSSDLCVVPGEVGLLAMHSLVYGTPLLTCENTRGMHGPEIETIKEGQTGGYFKDGDSVNLADKMEAMLYPVSCKDKMSAACKEIIDKYYTPEYQERIVVQALNYCLPPEKRIPVPD